MHLSFPDSEMLETATLVRFKVLVFFLVVFFAGCSELSEYDNRKIDEALGDSLLTTTESWGVEMEIIEEGLLKLKLTGSYSASINNENRSITRISGPVHIEIFDERGRLDTGVDADSAVNYPNKAEFEMFGNVHVQTSDGKKLRSSYLKWQRDQDKVSTPEFVIFISPPDSIAAEGFFGNTDLTNYTLNRGGGKAVID